MESNKGIHALQTRWSPFAADANNLSSIYSDIVPILLMLLGVANDMDTNEECLEQQIRPELGMSCTAFKEEDPTARELVLGKASIFVTVVGLFWVMMVAWQLIGDERETRMGK